MEGTIGEIRMFAGNFAPRTWALCQGQLLPISQNSALFSILGTIYGGDGRTTFGLPDLRGRVPVGPGTGPGLPSYREGQRGGAATNILNITQIPAHSHTGAVKVSSGNATQDAATNGASIATPGIGSGRSFKATEGFNTASPDITLNANSIQTGNTGGNQSVNNMQPFLSIHYIICLQGIFPSRN
ncbi:phage tail protein [Aquimarina sediminis]|uniref:phage tail protein n=1 Tax=Aquimarina sediminis TaxID=2070536 RepID=UPI000CA03032|nr:tail fiber protein [Aquimarina sediminis]